MALRSLLSWRAVGMAAFVLLGGLAGCGTSAFVCQSDVQCGADGVCSDDGRCNFPAEQCPSGLRFGFDGGPNAGECVPEGGGTVGSSGQDVTSGSSASGSAGSSTTLTTTSSTGTSGPTTSTSTAGSTSTSTTSPTSDSEAGSTGTPAAFCDSSDPTLVLCLEFSDPTANPIPDGSAYGNDAQAQGLLAIDSPYGTAAGFSPLAQVTVAAADSINLLDEVTVEVWVSVDQIPPLGARMGVIDKPFEYSVFILPDGVVQCGGFNGVQANGFVADDWAFIACVLEGAQWRAYLDGDPAALGGPGNPDPSTPEDVVIGANAPDYADPLVGGLYGVRVWAAALDDATIAGHVLPEG